jgi:hypothetical protein
LLSLALICLPFALLAIFVKYFLPVHLRSVGESAPTLPAMDAKLASHRT